ncbi:hypothetical protein PUR23_00825 [Methylorubrum populi]|uniref:hypothetical protein n=1 Tax=Methylorubrum populi TaxID=223967 RepID=UPI0031F7A5DA
MTAYCLGPEAHAAVLHSFNRIRAVVAAERQSLAESDLLTSEEGMELIQDEARLEVVKERIDHLASGNATAADAHHFNEVVSVMCAEITGRIQGLQTLRARLKGFIAFNELGANGNLTGTN